MQQYQSITMKSCLRELITKLLPEPPNPAIIIKNGLDTFFLK